ncbi:transferase [Propionivibrio limicola]|uniref:spermine/spermidine synthase domain-containing protein n=1 Tax=Propionivibrio limicola TaxID=167645 RepID=UPI0012922423|nr:transferase [Propionivibrio limicola]
MQNLHQTFPDQRVVLYDKQFGHSKKLFIEITWPDSNTNGESRKSALSTLAATTNTNDSTYLHCDNAQMKTHDSTNNLTSRALVHEENGELTLHFGGPTIQSRMSQKDSSHLVLDYTRAMMGFLFFLPSPKRIVMIGLGGGSIAKYCRSSLPTCAFDAVEISPHVIALRKKFDIPDDGPLFRVAQDDGARFIRHLHDQIDVLIVDGFDRDGQPESLSSLTFYDDCYSALRSDGMLVVNLCADDDRHGIYLDRIRQIFGSQTRMIKTDDGTNTIVFASKSKRFPINFADMAERLRRLEPVHAIELDRTALKILNSQ